MKNKKKALDINSIKSPEDIKSLSNRELEYLAIGIREFLIENISKTGGHLASNLGTVELTIGLHYVFDSPKDRIIWDVGHQAYTHKILTGRSEGFSDLRRFGGMSGFPKKKESEHDIYDTGHSSSSIAAALGMATARDLNKENYEIISVIGDGSMTGGPAFEALNNISQVKSKVIIILNDNGMSISSNIGGVSEHLGKLRTSRGYQDAKDKIKESLDKVPVIGSGMKNILGGTRDQLKYMILSGGILFEEMGLKYLGPYDGNNIKDVINALQQAKRSDAPVIVHFITTKGKGYKPAEKDPNKFHGIGSFDVETGETPSGKGESYSSIFGEAIYHLARKNSKITAITAAMCDATGLAKFEKEFPNRVFDVGIAEAYGTIFAAGQALSGYHPVVAIYSSFLQRAYDEILEDVCLQNLPVTFAIDRAGIVGSDGETHHGVFDLSYLLPMPGMTIYAPCNGRQLKDMLEMATKLDSPAAIRYPRGNENPEIRDIEHFKGKNIRLFYGKDVDILAVGSMVQNAIKAREILAEEGIDAGIVDIGIIKDGTTQLLSPWDYLIPEHPGEVAELIVTLEDNVVSGGFGHFFTSIYHNYFSIFEEERPIKIQRRIVNLGWPDEFIEHGSTEELYSKYGLDGEGIASEILYLFKHKLDEASRRKETSLNRKTLLKNIFENKEW